MEVSYVSKERSRPSRETFLSLERPPFSPFPRQRIDPMKRAACKTKPPIPKREVRAMRLIDDPDSFSGFLRFVLKEEL